MIPQQTAVAHFIQLGNADAVPIRFDMLRHDVHGYFTEVEICPNPRCGSDSRGLQHIQDHGHGKLSGCHFVGGQIIGCVDKHLVDGIRVNVLRGNILQVHTKNACAALHVFGHLRRRHNIIQRQLRRGLYLQIICGGAGQRAAGGIPLPLCIDLLDPLHHLKQPGPA